MLRISQVGSDSEIAAAGELIREYTAWATSLQASSFAAPPFKDLESELATLPGIYGPPSGRLLLAMWDEQPAGCVAFFAHDPQTCELRRLYVRPDFRGCGIGTELVRTLLQHAYQASFERIVLDSHIAMTDAHALYKALGFREMEAPENFPEIYLPYVLFMECELINRS
ncbi:MAG: GNAT family N-acetyltransferase [Chloroflexota bacterium]|nr:MAG: GNAT family N-acetyltransferase [Chloroflexota bacterium]